MESRGFLGRRTLSALAIIVLCSNMASAQTDSDVGWLGGSVTLSSEYVFRGVSQTMGRPSLQAYAIAEFDNGFYSYVWGSNIDFHPDSEPDDDARYEVDVAVGYAREFGSRWSLDVSVVRYLFPGTIDGIDYDYNELLTTLRYRDTLAATVGLAHDVDGTNTNARFYELESGFELPFDLAFDLAYGFYDLEDAYGDGYSYVRAEVKRYYDSSAIALSFNDTIAASDELFYEQASGSRFVLSLEFSF